MARGSRDADMLYDYLVAGHSQQTIADNFGMTQPEVSKLFREYYGLNKGNSKWGKGANNLAGKYKDLSYDDICDFVESGNDDFLDWYNGGSSNNSYQEPVQQYTPPANNYQSYSNPNYNQNSGGNSRNYGNNGRSQNYGNNGGNSSDFGGGILAVVCFILWIMKEIKTSSISFGDSFGFVFDSNYFWSGFYLAVIYGVVKYFMSRDLKYIFTTTGIYAWTALGFVLSAIKCYMDTHMFMPCVVLIVIGAAIGFIGYKLFYNE